MIQLNIPSETLNNILTEALELIEDVFEDQEQINDACKKIEEYFKDDMVTTVWCLEDFTKRLSPDEFTDEEIEQIGRAAMIMAEEYFDCSMGLDWDAISIYVDEAAQILKDKKAAAQ